MNQISIRAYIDIEVSKYYKICLGKIMFVVNTNGLEVHAKHSPDEVGPGEKTYLRKSSKAVAALRKVVFDKLWLNNLEFYVRFRLMFEVNM